MSCWSHWIVYRERDRVINTAKGDCLDRPVPESITRILRDTNGAETKPAADDGL